MVRATQDDERCGSGAFAPIPRPRLCARLEASADHPVTLLIAPAGYGKSVILRQYLSTLTTTHVRFALHPEHATLLGFLRGLAEALKDFVPHALATLAGAYDRNTTSSNRAGDLAAWLHAHLESFAGVIAIDDLHVADGDPEVAQFVAALMECSKDTIRWIIASRSTTGLPIGTWLAYHDADLPIDEHALRFTSAEAREAADRLGLAIQSEELARLLTLTDGWPAAMSFALRSSLRTSELRNVAALTREVIYRLLAEQIYSDLDNTERNLLEVAVALPAIDVGVLERAGFDRALTIVERLRERTAFIYEESEGIYQCHELFREFLRHQTALAGKRSQQNVYERAAQALEKSEDFEHAIPAYVLAGLTRDAVRLLEQHGFDLLERARADVVTRAIEALDESTRRENAPILALQGALQATAGRFARAEALFRRALAHANDDRDLVATVSLRLASLMANQGQDVGPVLEVVSSDPGQRSVYRAEALSLVAATRAISGDLASAASNVAAIESLLVDVGFDAKRARILRHLGIVARHIGETAIAMERLAESSELAVDVNAFGVASRGYAVLSNLVLHDRDDVDQQLQYAELAADAATKSGDAFSARTALLQILSAYMRKGTVGAIGRIEQRLTALGCDALTRRYVDAFRAIRLSWEGQFREAHWLLAEAWNRLASPVDRLMSCAHYALCLALDGQREQAILHVREVSSILATAGLSGRYGLRSASLSQVLCAIAEAANGRASVSERILRRLVSRDPVEIATVRTAQTVLRAMRSNEPCLWEEAISIAESLAGLSYDDARRVLLAAAAELRRQREEANGVKPLTKSERDVLRMLARGLSAKEIADDTHRSLGTVRAHIANAIYKLGCHGHLEAVQAARRHRLL